MSRRALAVTIAALTAALVLGSAGGVASAAGGAITLTPSTGLSNNQFVKVAWNGYDPLQVVFFRQCIAAPTNVGRDCTAIYSDVGFTDASGNGLLYEHVSQGEVASQSGGTFVCDRSHACKLGIFTDATLATGVFASVGFAPTPDACPTPAGAAISGGGADQAFRAVYRWEIAMCGPPAKLGVNYIPANSEDGRSNFVNGLNDFAVTATPFTDDQKKALDKAGRTFQYAPLTTSGLVLAYKVFDQDAAHAEPGAQVTDLKLTPALAARIFTGQLTNWHVDPEINALNPGHVFPPSVRALVRGDHSSANLEFTSWLSAAGGSALPTDWPGPGEDYPLKYLVQDSGIVGGDKLADAIADPKTASLNTDYFNAGYIGFIDSSQASYYGLPTAKIENAAGQFVAATPQSITAALSHATTNADGVTLSPNFADTDPDDYPMPMVTYVTAPTSKVYEGRGITLRSFLTYAIGDAQTTLPDGYFPLSDAMKQQTQDAISKIPTSTAPAPGSGGTPYPTGNPPGSGTVPPGGTTPVYPTGGTGPAGNVPGSTAPPAASGCTDGSKSADCAAAPAPDLPVGVLQIEPARLVLPGVAALSALGLLGGLALLGLPDSVGSRVPRLRLRP